MPLTGTVRIMKTIQVFVDNEDFVNVCQGHLKWVLVSSGFKAEVGDILLVIPNTQINDGNPGAVTAKQVTHVLSDALSPPGDCSRSFDVCSLSGVFDSALPF